MRAHGIADQSSTIAFARLCAAELIDAGKYLDRFSVEALIQAIGEAPMHRVGEYYYFDPQEFLECLVRRDGETRTATLLIPEPVTS
jgi:hypothetical protein